MQLLIENMMNEIQEQDVTQAEAQCSLVNAQRADVLWPQQC